jgi:anti-sigma B factor antagonist
MAPVYVQVVTELSFEVLHAAETVTVRLDGELDKVAAPVFRERLGGLSAGGRLDVVIDASRLTFCDSSGLWALVELQRGIAERGGSVTLTGVHGVLQRVLDVTGLKAVFDEVLPAQL